MNNQIYDVFGFGRYGRAVATELVRNGAEVLAVDANQSIVNAAAAELPVCKCADVTEKEALSRLGIANIDTVVIAMAGRLESSVMATLLCKEAGVKNVIVKCATEMHSKILSRVGADRVILPEHESGIRLAKNLTSAGFVDVIDLSDDVSMVELDVRADWTGKTLAELGLRRKYSINVMGVRRGDSVSINVDPNVPLEADTRLIVIANTEKLKKLK